MKTMRMMGIVGLIGVMLALSGCSQMETKGTKGAELEARVAAAEKRIAELEVPKPAEKISEMRTIRFPAATNESDFYAALAQVQPPESATVQEMDDMFKRINIGAELLEAKAKVQKKLALARIRYSVDHNQITVLEAYKKWDDAEQEYERLTENREMGILQKTIELKKERLREAQRAE